MFGVAGDLASAKALGSQLERKQASRMCYPATGKVRASRTSDLYSSTLACYVVCDVSIFEYTGIQKRIAHPLQPPTTFPLVTNPLMP